MNKEFGNPLISLSPKAITHPSTIKSQTESETKPQSQTESETKPTTNSSILHPTPMRMRTPQPQTSKPQSQKESESESEPEPEPGSQASVENEATQMSRLCNKFMFNGGFVKLNTVYGYGSGLDCYIAMGNYILNHYQSRSALKADIDVLSHGKMRDISVRCGGGCKIGSKSFMSRNIADKLFQLTKSYWRYNK